MLFNNLRIESITSYPQNPYGPSAQVHVDGVDGCFFEVYDGFTPEGAEETARKLIKFIEALEILVEAIRERNRRSGGCLLCATNDMNAHAELCPLSRF
jgi:hypothetical protein